MNKFDDVSKVMGGGDEPASYLRLKIENEPEVVIFKDIETVEANQRELQQDYHTNGNTVLYTFESPTTGKIRTHRANGQALLIGLKNAIVPHETDEVGKSPNIRPIEEGEVCSIKRTGEGQDTRNTVTIFSKEQGEKYMEENRQVDAEEVKQTFAEPTTTAPPKSDIPAEKMDTAQRTSENVDLDSIPF